MEKRERTEEARIREIRDEIYNVRKGKNFYQSNSFASACYYLTVAFENRMQEIMSPSSLSMGLSNLQALHDNMRGCYRETLKNAYKFCKTDGSFSFVYDKEKLQEADEEIDDAVQFNKLRNTFEKWESGRLAACVEGKKVVFSRVKEQRSEDADIYNQILDFLKPEETRKTDEAKCTSQLVQYLSTPEFERKWDDKKQKPKTKTFFNQIKESAYEKILLEAEEKSDYEFTGFSLDNFREIYAVLLALGVMKFNYSFINTLYTPYFYDSQPIILMKKEDLLGFIQENTKLDEACIGKVIEYLIYDPDFHKDKIGIFQPLFSFNDFVFYSPMMIYFSFAQDKFLYVIKEKKEYNTVISQLARNKEKIMTDEILDFIEEKSELSFEPNYVISEGVKKRAEFDLVLYDDDNNKALLVELKWYFKSDTEKQFTATDNKLMKTVKDRVEKERLFKQNARARIQEIFGGGNDEPEIMSCVVSRNYAGSALVYDDIPVLDEYLFKTILEDVSFNFNRLFEKMRAKNYIPAFASEGIHYVNEEVEYAGYHIYYPRIGLAGEEAEFGGA